MWPRLVFWIASIALIPVAKCVWNRILESPSYQDDVVRANAERTAKEKAEKEELEFLRAEHRKEEHNANINNGLWSAGGGKTTYIDELLIKKPDYQLVNSDLFWTRNEEGKRVWKDKKYMERDWGTEPINNDALQWAYSWAFRQLVRHLEKGLDIIYEATFVSKKDRKSVIKLAKGGEQRLPISKPYRIEGVFFNPTLLECVVRNGKRRDRVPDVVLARTYAKIQIPTPREGFDKLEII